MAKRLDKLLVALLLAVTALVVGVTVPAGVRAQQEGVAATPTNTAVGQATQSATPTASPTASVGPSMSVTAPEARVREGGRRYLYLPFIRRSEPPPTPTATATATPTRLPSMTPTRTQTPSPTPTRTQTPSPTATRLPTGDAVTADTPILGSPRSSVAQMIAEIRSRGNGEYTEYDVRQIVAQYDLICREVGIDPTLAVAQMLHETGYMTSFWAARPRRNPAGIGVTGQTSATEPPDTTNWAYDPALGLWRYGISFPSWDESVRAQVGRLLAYALTDAEASPAQKALIAEALGWRGLPGHLRGSADTLKQLGAKHNPTGSGWASPGDNYGEAIARIAERIRRR